MYREQKWLIFILGKIFFNPTIFQETEKFIFFSRYEDFHIKDDEMLSLMDFVDFGYTNNNLYAR